MRSSGGRGADGWMLGIPVLALVVAGAMSSGGLHSMLLTLDSGIRHSFAAAVAFVSKLF